MKHLFVLLFVSVIFVSCDLFIEPQSSSCEPGEFITREYTRDAEQLFLRYMRFGNKYDVRNDPYIDRQKVKEILSAMQAIYNLGTPETEFIFRNYGIHAFPTYSLNSVTVKIDPENDVIKNLLNGVRPAGDVKLDRILEQFHLNYYLTSSNPDGNHITLYSDSTYNTYAIETMLTRLPYIDEPDSRPMQLRFGTYTDIEYGDGDSRKLFDFSLHEGPILEPTGGNSEMKVKHWVYTVNNCEAQLVNKYEE